VIDLVAGVSQANVQFESIVPAGRKVVSHFCIRISNAESVAVLTNPHAAGGPNASQELLRPKLEDGLFQQAQMFALEQIPAKSFVGSRERQLAVSRKLPIAILLRGLPAGMAESPLSGLASVFLLPKRLWPCNPALPLRESKFGAISLFAMGDHQFLEMPMTDCRLLPARALPTPTDAAKALTLPGLGPVCAFGIVREGRAALPVSASPCRATCARQDRESG
jgi:hypothetical protein